MPVRSPCHTCTNADKPKNACAVYCTQRREYADSIINGAPEQINPPEKIPTHGQKIFCSCERQRKMTEKDRQIIREMAAHGRSNSAISAAIDFTVSSIRTFRSRNGILQKPRISKKEIGQVLELRKKQKLPISVIAKKMNRSWITIRTAINNAV